jgi:hypothetical protein
MDDAFLNSLARTVNKIEPGKHAPSGGFPAPCVSRPTR